VPALPAARPAITSAPPADLGRALAAAPAPTSANRAAEAVPLPVATATTASARLGHDAALLAAADLPAFPTLSATPIQQLLHDPEVLRHFDEIRRRLLQMDEGHRAMVATGLGVTGGLSIGYVVWLVRGGVLVSSMLSALPAWQMIDPLPVLASARKGGRGGRDAAIGDDREVERLFDERARARRARGTAPAVPDPAVPDPAAVDPREAPR
jgi:hypothetical protein